MAIPSEISPPAMLETRSPTCCHVTLSQLWSCGYRNASACGVAATRSTNMCATDGARFSILVKSGLSGEASDVFISLIHWCLIEYRWPCYQVFLRSCCGRVGPG